MSVATSTAVLGAAAIGAGASVYAASQSGGGGAPAPLDPSQIGNSSLATQLQLAGPVYNATSQYQPQYIALQQQGIQQQLYGSFDANKFFQANPDALKQYQDATAAGGLQGWTPQQFAQAYLGGPENGHGQLSDYSSGGLLDFYSNQGPALAKSLSDSYAAANPQLTASMGNLQGQISGATTYQGNGATANGTYASPALANTSMAGYSAAQRGTLSPQLEADASAKLASNGALTKGEQTSIAESTMGAYGDRGLADSAGAISALALNSDAAVQARQQQNQSYAENVAGLNQAYNLNDASSLNANRQFNAAALNSGSQFNAGNLTNTSQFNSGQANNLSTFNAGQSNQLAQFNAQMSAQQQQQNFQNQYGLTQLYQQQAVNPASLASGVLSQAASLGNGGTPTFDPFNSSISSIYNTNYNAANAANISGNNNSAALYGAGIGAIGSLTGGYLSGGYCWLARAVYGANSPRWLRFRHWLLTKGQPELVEAYGRNAPAAAARARRDPVFKAHVRALMDQILNTEEYAHAL